MWQRFRLDWISRQESALVMSGYYFAPLQQHITRPLSSTISQQSCRNIFTKKKGFAVLFINIIMYGEKWIYIYINKQTLNSCRKINRIIQLYQNFSCLLNTCGSGNFRPKLNKDCTPVCGEIKIGLVQVYFITIIYFKKIICVMINNSK